MGRIHAFFLVGVLIIVVLCNDLSKAMLLEDEQLRAIIKNIKASHQKAQEEATSDNVSSAEENSTLNGHIIAVHQWEDCSGCLQMMKQKMENINYVTRFKAEIKMLQNLNLMVIQQQGTLIRQLSSGKRLSQSPSQGQTRSQSQSQSQSQQVQILHDEAPANNSCWQLLKIALKKFCSY
jgi:hypothetical protein